MPIISLAQLPGGILPSRFFILHAAKVKRGNLLGNLVKFFEANAIINIGTQGVQELFFVNIKLRQVANSACQSIVRLPV